MLELTDAVVDLLVSVYNLLPKDNEITDDFEDFLTKLIALNSAERE